MARLGLEQHLKIRAGTVARLYTKQAEREFCRSAARHAGASKRCGERQASTGPAVNKTRQTLDGRLTNLLPHKELRGIIFTMQPRRIINKQLGKLLLDRGIINQCQLDQALKIQRDQGGLIGVILVKLGFAGEEDIAQSLTAQYGFPYLPLSNYDVSPEITGIIPGRVASQYLLVPIDKIGNNLTLAMSNPLDIRAIEDVELLSGCSVQAFVSTLSDIKRAIDKYYKNKE